LFVVNKSAAAIQQKDGKYYTHYFSLTPYIIGNMLKCHGSMGVYQQIKGKLKWICFDFDCRDKVAPNITDLYYNVVVPFCSDLKKNNISYLVEYSGRRGIHVWIIFDRLISKRLGYKIVCSLKSDLNFDVVKFGLDLFPATPDASNNKVGKQVKIPLSTHQMSGKSSYFITEKSLDIENNSLGMQYAILEKYEVNKVDDVLKTLNVDENETCNYIFKYKKFAINDINVSNYNNIEIRLKSINIFKELLNKVDNGNLLTRDYFVLLGTLGRIGSDYSFFKYILSKSDLYDDELTQDYIDKWGQNYYPATLGYLYDLYDLDLEETLDPNKTALDYLKDDINGISLEEFVPNTCLNERDNLLNLDIVHRKEQKYFLNNDEVIDVSIYNDFLMYNDSIKNRIMKKIGNIIKGEYNINKDIHFIKYLRKESLERTRDLISLNVEDRLITTYLSTNIAYSLRKNSNAFSYNLSYFSHEDLFYNWYNSWQNFINKISLYFEIPFFEDLGIMVLDIHHFYDDIDFLAMYNHLSAKIKEAKSVYRKEELMNMFTYLLHFNEKMMRQIKNTRRGVPQGPAYARILAEIYIDQIIEEHIKVKYESGIYIFRYVDDIVIFYEPSVDGRKLFEYFEKELNKVGLKLNLTKSKHYGQIKSISKSDKIDIMRSDKLTYELNKDKSSLFLLSDEKNAVYESYFKEKYDINKSTLFLGKITDEFYKDKYFLENCKNIFEEEFGRGAAFIRFYDILFSNEKYIYLALKNNYFNLIPKNTINFSNFISCYYLAIKNRIISIDYISRINLEFLSKLHLEQIEDNQRSTIEGIIFWENSNEYINWKYN
ncbi:MAG: RNA-directed DNA polymerase, partial [Malacoplasma sp.]